MPESFDAKYPRVNFRLGAHLEPSLDERTGAMGTTDSIAKRDLERYYDLLKFTLASMPKFTVNEAMLIVDSLNGVLLRAESISLLWANVADAIRMDGLATKWEVDGETLIERLQGLSYFEAMAVGDAVERAWSGDHHVTNMRERVVAVGLAKSDVR